MIKTTQIFIDSTERIYSIINRRGTKKKGIAVFRCADEDKIEIRIWWQQGINTWYIAAFLTREEQIKVDTEYIIDIVRELINIRDTKMDSIYYWTNCKWD